MEHKLTSLEVRRGPDGHSTIENHLNYWSGEGWTLFHVEIGPVTDFYKYYTFIWQRDA